VENSNIPFGSLEIPALIMVSNKNNKTIIYVKIAQLNSPSVMVKTYTLALPIVNNVIIKILVKNAFSNPQIKNSTWMKNNNVYQPKNVELENMPMMQLENVKAVMNLVKLV